ncbi:hypothetical protein V495_01336 [Pseudogymnoascus sp. VKM F-4514 (FW-929)]|nr:hypothetical protein V495_01336 [Pseudogymnoascus sp. VKM F-4514 (FW-929)]
MYEAMCAFAEDVRQEKGGAVEEDEGAAGADAASLKIPMPGINQHGHLELPRGLTQEEFSAGGRGSCRRRRREPQNADAGHQPARPPRAAPGSDPGGVLGRASPAPG